MKRSRIVSLQLVALGLLVVLLCYRVVVGPALPDGVVVFADLEPRHLHHEAFALEHPATFTVEAAGSYERAGGPAGTPALAAYAWVVRRGDRRVVWHMGPENTQPGRGTLAHTQDRFTLEPGLYDVYFASYGNAFTTNHELSFFRRVIDPEHHWQNDHRKWRFVLRAADDSNPAVRRLHEGEAAVPQGRGVVWTSAPVTNNKETEALLEVRRPTRVHLYAVGEFNGTAKDYAWIENVATEDRTWEMTRENTQPAGGAAENRLYEGVVRLEPGLYRAVYKTDRTHAYRDWRANPPLDPAAWGMTLRVLQPADTAAIRPFDPWRMRRPVISITRVTDDHLRSTQFTVDRPLRLLVYAVGEIVGKNLYDFAWIEHDDTKARVWEMQPEGSRPAGGDQKNRLVMDFLQLPPGTYTVYYQTDDSHAYGSWNAQEPEHPERWGVTLFPIDPALPEEAVHILRQQTLTEGPEGETPEPPMPPVPLTAAGEVLLDELKLGNEVRLEVPFEVQEPTTLHIYAVGEITPRGRYDYGWIERAGTGETAWDMTWQNTRPAGGDDRNRLFDGPVRLQPGRYIVHFRTDLSHAYGDFGEAAPHVGRSWGIAIRRVE